MDSLAIRRRVVGTALVPTAAAVVVSAFAAITAARGVVVTAGGRDQRNFHWVAIWQMREAFPNVDVSNVKSATAPLYHLVVAAVSKLLNLGEAGTQFVGSLFGAALAAVVFWFAGSATSGWLRVLAVSPLLLSAYFWQSTLWMLNDAAALLFAFLAFA